MASGRGAQAHVLEWGRLGSMEVRWVKKELRMNWGENYQIHYMKSLKELTKKLTTERNGCLSSHTAVGGV